MTAHIMPLSLRFNAFGKYFGIAMLLLPFLFSSRSFAQNTPMQNIPMQGVASPIITPIQLPNLPLGVVSFPNGKAINLSVAMGSSAYAAAGDAQGRLWLLTDRGPTIECGDIKRLVGLDAEALCGGEKSGRVYPLPGFAPSIYGVDIGPDNQARIAVFLPLKGKSGRPVSGRPMNMSLPDGEPAFSNEGRPLPPDPSGVDPEAFVRLKDGDFWVAEEFGPSLLHVAADGTILKRLVPEGSIADYKDADYEVLPILPPVMRKRKNGYGLEGLALSPDEKYLYMMMQAPLANPDAGAAKSARYSRLWTIERETGRVVATYLYPLEALDATREATGQDNALQDKPVTEHSAEAGHLAHSVVSEIVTTGENTLLVMERLGRTFQITSVTLDEAKKIPPLFNRLEKVPALESLDEAGLSVRGFEMLKKTTLFQSTPTQGLSSRIEGMAHLSAQETILINDNAFALDGGRTQMYRFTWPQPILR